MNESKMNKSVIRRDSIQTRISSNVSSLVKQEEKVYVRSYTMTKKKRLAWIENNFQGEDEQILHPPLREFRANEAASDPEIRDKAKLMIFCIAIALVLLLAILAIKISATYLVIGDIRLEGSSLYTETEILDAGGLVMGGGLPLLRTSSAESSILENLPYVQSCEISFELPNVMIVNIIDEAPAIYTEINGEYYILTSSLRVLERTLEKEKISERLYVELPPITRAMVGEVIVLDKTEINYITEFFDLISTSALKGRLGVVYFDKKFDIIASVDGKYRVLFGSPSDMALKIDAVATIIAENDEMCSESGIIDVRITNVCGIINEAGIDPNSRE